MALIRLTTHVEWGGGDVKVVVESDSVDDAMRTMDEIHSNYTEGTDAPTD